MRGRRQLQNLVCTLKYKGNMTLGVESKLQLQVVGALNVNITISVQEIAAKVRAPPPLTPSAEREALTSLFCVPACRPTGAHPNIHDGPALC